jgi:hypothetical protein
MPFKSEAQRRKLYALEAEGKLKKGTCEKWEAETPKGIKLPERLTPKKAHGEGVKEALETFNVKLAVFPLAAAIPAAGTALMAGARMALPWMARTFMGAGAKRVASGAAVNAGISGAAHLAGNGGNTNGLGSAMAAGGMQGGLMGALPGPKPQPMSIGQV